mgnify:CR=1 FL=1
MTDPEVDRENRQWVRDLSGRGLAREAACRELYGLLLRVARSESRRRAPSLRLMGPELEDIAHQATADALMAITARLDRFRGEAKFTTWATKFVIYDVGTKMNRHAWHRHEIPLEHEDRSEVAYRFDLRPDEEAQVHELADSVSKAIREDLSDRQRLVFVATVLKGMPVDALASELGSTKNALYKVLFDARKNLRIALNAAGHLS